MAGRFGAVQPQTRSGYMFGARRQDIPWESEGPDTSRRFNRQKAPRMAGDKDLSGLRPGQKDAPHGVGRGFVPEDKGAWEIDPREDAYAQDNPWDTFNDEDLEPKVARW
jgi:hypothetical protein